MSEDAAAGTEPGRSWFSPGRFAALLAALILIPFWEVVSGSQSFVVRDFGLFSYPVASYLRDSFWRGEWPLWNPLSCCGAPFLAQLNTLALYPPSLIYVLLPLSWALPFFCLLHLYLGGIGMYFLARRWSGSQLGGAVAGTVFAFNGLSLNLLMWPSHIATYALMPWVIWLALGAWETGGRRLVLTPRAGGNAGSAGGRPGNYFVYLVDSRRTAGPAIPKGARPAVGAGAALFCGGLSGVMLDGSAIAAVHSVEPEFQPQQRLWQCGVVDARVGLGKFPGAAFPNFAVA